MKARLLNDVSRPPSRRSGAMARRAGGFTLLELLTALTITSMLVVMLFAAFNQASKAWTTAENRVETFTDARAALDFMAREISQTIVTNKISFLAQESTMTLGSINPVPTLHFGNVAFVAPVGSGASDGMDLMEVVYRLSLQSASVAITPSAPNPFTNSVPPYQLVRRVTPYNSTTAAKTWLDYGKDTIITVIPANNPWDFYTSPATWPETSETNRTAVLAENVMSLQFTFEDDQNPPTTYATPDYWNSTTSIAWQNELSPVVPAGTGRMLGRAPSRVIITLTVLDSRAAVRYKATSDQDAKERIYQESQRTFTTSAYIPNRQP